MLGRGGLGAAHWDLLPMSLAGLLLAIYPCVFDFPSFVFFVLRVFFVFVVPSAQIRENRDQPTSIVARALG